MREFWGMVFIVILRVVSLAILGAGEVFKGAGNCVHVYCMRVGGRHDRKYGLVEDREEPTPSELN